MTTLLQDMRYGLRLLWRPFSSLTRYDHLNRTMLLGEPLMLGV
jgi:aromatic ring-cleaving dioxygenase